MEASLPPLHALVAFDATARHGSIKRAAEELRVSPSAVSQHVKALEGWMGTALFERRHRRLVLTDTGSRYHLEISAGLTRISSATAIATRAAENSLRLGAPTSFAHCWLAPRLPAFRRRCPGVALSLSLAQSMDSFAFEDPTNSLVEVTAAKCDVTIRMGHGRWAGTEPLKLQDDDAFPVCSPDFLRQCGGHLEAADVARAALLDDTMPETWQDWFTAAGLSDVPDCRPTMFFSHTFLMLDAAIAGLGIALSHSLFVDQYLRSGQLVRVAEASIPAEFSYYAVPEPSRANQPAVRDCLAWLSDEAAKTRA